MEKQKRNIVEWAMHYRHIVILITCCLMAFGVYSLGEMNKNEFPDFVIRQGVVVAVYPGATASEVEQQLTKPLEHYIFSYKEVNKAKTVSYSRNGMAIIQVELNDELNDKDEFWSKFKHGINEFKGSLPSGVLAVVVKDDFGDSSALLITMESQDKTYRELHDYMNALQDSLRKIESVGRMTVTGEQQEQISIYLDEQRLTHYGMSDQTIALSLMSKGLITTAGQLKDRHHNSPLYVARTMNAAADVEQQIVYSDAKGNVVRLKDVATVRREYAPLTNYVTNNGTKCLVLSVEMKKGRNIVDMGQKIYSALDHFQATLPQSVTLFKITDQAKVVSDSVWNFLRELLIAIVAVIIVVVLLMPLRVALVASSTIPITIFIALSIFNAFHIELNTVTLAALIVTLGMIVDNSIVIIDSYVEQLAEGKSRWHASIDSAQHFFKSILSATLAISVTFFPFLMVMTGNFHDFLLSFPWAITIILLVSLAVAELVVPFLQFYFIRRPLAETGSKKQKSGFLDLMQKGYDRLIGLCFRHPYLTLGAGALSIVAGILMMRSLPQRLMPAAERNQFAIEIYLPTGTAVSLTALVADSIESVLQQDPRVVSIASFKGMASPRFQTGYAPQFAGENYAQFIVNTTDDKATVEVLEKYRPLLQDAFPEAYVKFKQLAYGTDANPVEVRITGDDWQQLKAVSDTLTALLRLMPELNLVRSDLKEPLVATEITLDTDRAARLGLSAATTELSMALRYNSQGITVGNIWQDDYNIPVRLKTEHSNQADRQTVEEEQLPAVGGLGSAALRQVATVSVRPEDGQISHRNGLRTITIMAEVAQGLNSTAVNQKVISRLSDKQKAYAPTGISISYGGESESNAENMPKIVAALAIAVMIIFFILLGHFRRISTAVLLLASLLLTLFGTAAGIMVQGVDFSLTSILGIVSLMGILVRNAIIMYDYAEELRNLEGMKARDAIFTSAKRRMRPIFLTSAAASMGVIPMILSKSSLWMPMGVVICYGTLITMVFILTILPVAYWLMMSGSTKKRELNNALEQQ
ncbi:MAG: efflux RND transporter permease subunit [Bacteroidaceae bacterium]|nr:efflux RND transporter permease subunit [Bacteroidaceae bacterium]